MQGEWLRNIFSFTRGYLENRKLYPDRWKSVLKSEIRRFRWCSARWPEVAILEDIAVQSFPNFDTFLIKFPSKLRDRLLFISGKILLATILIVVYRRFWINLKTPTIGASFNSFNQSIIFDNLRETCEWTSYTYTYNPKNIYAKVEG